MEILLFGASVRSLAFSVIAGGDRPIGVDLFGDWDLMGRCPAHRISFADYPTGFRRFAEELRGRPWIYTGGLENYPDLIDELAAYGPLWGNDGARLRKVRDPRTLSTALENAGFTPPAVRDSPEGLPTDGSWLVKPRRGSGGRGVTPWLGGPSPKESYWQEFVSGASYAAIYVGDGLGAELVGTTKQWIGRSECHAPAFAYSGSAGPWPLGREAQAALASLGDCLGSSFGLRGWFGVDFIDDGGELRTIEVNPRFTASIEVLEHSLGVNAYQLHRRIFMGESQIPRAATPPLGSVAKAVLFAEKGCRVSPGADCYRRVSPEQGGSWFADVPTLGTDFEPGDPILTVLACGPSVAEAESRLWESIRRFEHDGIECKP